MKFAFVFPGQGSQSVGMMSGYGEHAVIRATFDEASAVLGTDLWALVNAGPAETLNLTTNTQPAMLAAGVAVYRLWRELGGPEPQVMAGHSLGEYTALTCAGALDFADALRLVRTRAEAMQAAVPEGHGGMAAILGLEDSVVEELCREAAQGQVVAAVNFNCPGQVVIAGERPAVERAMDLAKARGAKRVLLLPVSVPSHCALMQPAAEALRQALAAVEICTPRIPVLHNVDVATHETPESIRTALAQQLYSPVRWVQTLRTLRDMGVALIAECGPGKVLSGLNRRVLSDLPTPALADAVSLTETLDRVKN